MTEKKQILGNTFIQFIGRIITALLAIISVKLITSYLGVAGYGSYTTVYEFVGLFAIIGDLGLYTIAIREMAENEKESQKIYSNVLTMRAVFTALVMVLVGIGGMFIPPYQDSLIPMGIWICTLGVWLNLFYSIVSSILQYKLKMQLATKALIAGKIMSLLTVLAAVLFIQNKTIGFFTIVAAGIVGHGVMLFIGILYARRYISVVFECDITYWKQLLKKSWAYGLALILGTIYFKVDVTILSLFRSQEEVGLYGVPVRMIEVLAVLPLFFMNSILASMSKAIKTSKEAMQSLFQFSFNFLFVVACLIFLGIYFLAPDVVALVSDSSFLSTQERVGADTILFLLIIAMLIYFFSTLCSFTLVAFHKQHKVLWVNAVGAGLNIITNLYAIPYYGIIGAAFTSILSEIIVLIVATSMLYRVFLFRLDLIFILKVLLSTALVFAISYNLFLFMGSWSTFMRFLVLGASIVILYWGFLYSFGITKGVMNYIKNK